MKIINFIYGAIIGIANIIPGVSGGTMAVVLGIYDQLISAVANLRSRFKDSLLLLIPVGIGAVCGIVLFSWIIDFCLTQFPSITNMAFVGLIAGSVPMIEKKLRKRKVKTSVVLSFVVTLGIMVVMGIVSPDDSNKELITTLSFGSGITLFLAGVVSAASMIIPGVSGSFMMLLLGTYTSVLAAVKSFNLAILIPVGLGCVVGIFLCAKIIERLFDNFPTQTYAGILGLMLGSIFVLVPPLSGVTGVIAVAVACGTGYGAYFFSKR